MGLRGLKGFEAKAKAYIKQNVNFHLNKNPRSHGNLEFKVEFIPNAQDVVACSNTHQDIELAEHLKYLIESNKSGNAEKIEINGYISLDKEHLRRPEDGKCVDSRLYLFMQGNFPHILKQLAKSCSGFGDGGFQFNFEKLFLGQVKQYCCSGYEYFMHVGQGNLTMFVFINAETWDLYYGNGNVDPTDAQLTLIFGTKSENYDWTTSQLPYIFPKGRDYCLPPALRRIVESRLQKIESGKILDVVIVGDSDREWTVYQKYLVESSDVFQAMLETKGFQEEETKRIKLPGIGDELIEELLKYLNFFDMDAIFQDFRIAIGLLEVAERYQINKLKGYIHKMLLQRPNEDFETGQALKLFAYTTNLVHFKDLSQKVIEILTEKCEDLQDSQELCEFLHKKPNTAQELFHLALVTLKGAKK